MVEVVVVVVEVEVVVAVVEVSVGVVVVVVGFDHRGIGIGSRDIHDCLVVPFESGVGVTDGARFDDDGGTNEDVVGSGFSMEGSVEGSVEGNSVNISSFHMISR